MILPNRYELQTLAVDACYKLGIDPYTSFPQANGDWMQQWEVMAEDIRRHVVLQHAANAALARAVGL